ncbi:hypothetical protein [Vibrio vulnificus YJ016]|uniref:Uncharacterized protein n=1 Tax=Vibrio vulnificus (strain YJ016) TaxID=196600 RepID=Q7MQ15_VIBVY|nr:hypothetical protein [Vibrio vulnificus YJ016]
MMTAALREILLLSLSSYIEKASLLECLGFAPVFERVETKAQNRISQMGRRDGIG